MIDSQYTYGSPSKTAAIMGGSPMRTIAERACAISGSPITSPLKQPRHGEAQLGANDYQPINRADIIGKPIEII